MTQLKVFRSVNDKLAMILVDNINYQTNSYFKDFNE